MKFRFLGGMDCPDFVLNEIAASSKLSAIKYRGICQLGADYLTALSEPETADTSLQNFVTNDLDIQALRRIFLIIRFILQKAAGYDCAAEDLESELCQLGLPPEHSKMLARVYAKAREAVKDRQVQNLMKKPSFDLKRVERGERGVVLSGKVEDRNVTYSFGKATFEDFCEELQRIDSLIKEKF